MIILPAIDIKNGQCVRLVRGDYATAKRVAEDPLKTAGKFQEEGAGWLHLVDLDGAKEGQPKNAGLIKKLAKIKGLRTQIGGGIRDRKTVGEYIEAGASRVILGSAAVKDPELVKESVREFSDKIAVGIDARNQYAATEGWTDRSSLHFLELAKRMEEMGVRTLIYTDISRDGTLQGLNLEELEAIQKAVSCRIIASGGVRSLEDVRNCKRLGLYGCICGKALYSGALNLSEALREAGGEEC